MQNEKNECYTYSKKHRIILNIIIVVKQDVRFRARRVNWDPGHRSWRLGTPDLNEHVTTSVSLFSYLTLALTVWVRLVSGIVLHSIVCAINRHILAHFPRPLVTKER